TRTFWRVNGRPVDLAGDERWLDAPMHDTQAVGDRWLHAAAATHGGTVGEHVHGRGLLDDMARLDGPDFRADDLRPEIRDFYEHTSSWRMEVWTQWSPVFRPAGELVSRLFGRRVQQLALPTRPLDVAHGMDSRVVAILAPSGEQRAAAWIRTLRSTGEYVYSGCYSSRLLPGSRQPSVHVAFPLQAGNVQVFLRPAVSSDGTLTLTSPAGRFGEDGAYVVVDDRGAFHAARAPLHETFRLYVDDEGVLRTDHVLRLWAAPVVRLHYKLTGQAAAAPDASTVPEQDQTRNRGGETHER
ncbi:MAG: hypothetical protein M3165_06145, partial [Actinomycetota bacterium]|nr:hypothetical protein [Actinomycetota bacterium]